MKLKIKEQVEEEANLVALLESIRQCESYQVEHLVYIVWGGVAKLKSAAAKAIGEKGNMIKQFVTEIIELLRSEFHVGEEAFHPPATEQQLQEAEVELGFALPADLRELYLVLNGEREGGFGLFFGLPFLSLADMMAESRSWAGLEQEYALEGGHF
ncbi:hypothetical protein J2X83_000681 [Brevibacillus nitrificans]|nr:hypothetical protein [Brevibacillus nitrificans]